MTNEGCIKAHWQADKARIKLISIRTSKNTLKDMKSAIRQREIRLASFHYCRVWEQKKKTEAFESKHEDQDIHNSRKWKKPPSGSVDGCPVITEEHHLTYQVPALLRSTEITGCNQFFSSDCWFWIIGGKNLKWIGKTTQWEKYLISLGGLTFLTWSQLWNWVAANSYVSDFIKTSELDGPEQNLKDLNIFRKLL